MKRLVISSGVVTAGLVAAACGSTSGSSGSTSAPGGTTPAGGTNTVAVKQVNGVGNVLVDSAGKALYTPDQEADGKVRCSGGCTSFWTPLAPGGGSAAPTSDVANLGVIQRPDGTKQVTDNGKPLYTFTEDSAGKVKGDGFSDDFGSQHFTWHVVHAQGTTAGSSGAVPSTGSSTTGNPNGAGAGNGY
jgi:predicted lipoprotein with Yx(FWY)xxD motif